MARVLILANSRKMKGRCVAGIDLDTMRWVRPVTSKDNGDLTVDQTKARSEDGRVEPVEPGDIVEMSLGGPAASAHHPEDRLYVGRWIKTAHLDTGEIVDLVRNSIDSTGPTLELPDGTTELARIRAVGIERSLCLVRCDEVTVTTGPSGLKLKHRVGLELPGGREDLPLSDLAWESRGFTAYEDGRSVLELGACLVTVSLTEPFPRERDEVMCCSKVVAAVLPLNPWTEEE